MTTNTLQSMTLGQIIAANRHLPRKITYFDSEDAVSEVSFADLYERALATLHTLQCRGIQPGDKMILLLDDNEHFIYAFWAAVLGGVVAVPVTLGVSDEHHHKVLKIAEKLGNPFIYTHQQALQTLSMFASGCGRTACFARLRHRSFLAEESHESTQPGQIYEASPDDVALIQFSSGSTSEPKGVVLTHRNLVTNCLGIIGGAGVTEDDVLLSWLPLTHDMGLIGMHLAFFVARAHVHLMRTDLFVRRPLAWLSLASRVRASFLCSPNFGYSLYLKALDEQSVEHLDLSPIRVIFNGAEPISAELCAQFTARLAPAKLSPTAMLTVYGLAEASVGVSFPQVGTPVKAITVNRHNITVGVRLDEVPAAHPDAIQFVSEGKAIPYCQLRVAGDDDQVLPEGHVGHVQIAGENVTRGYYDIVINGHNYYPHDIEAVCRRETALELSKLVAVGLRPRQSHAEQLVIFVVHRDSMRAFAPVAAQVSGALARSAGLEVFAVIPVKRIPKTTSGKIQRHVLAHRYLNGEFDDQLRELAMLRDSPAANGSSRRSGVEALLQYICSVALQGRQLGVHDNLFESGANSLQLVAIHEQIDQRFPGSVDLSELYELPTIAALSERLVSQAANAA